MAKEKSEWEGLAHNAARVFSYLLTGHELTQLVAFNNLAIGSLTSRISDIKKWLAKEEAVIEGKVISLKSEWRKDFEGKRYKAYWLHGLEDKKLEPEVIAKDEAASK